MSNGIVDPVVETLNQIENIAKSTTELEIKQGQQINAITNMALRYKLTEDAKDLQEINSVIDSNIDFIQGNDKYKGYINTITDQASYDKVVGFIDEQIEDLTNFAMKPGSVIDLDHPAFSSYNRLKKYILPEHFQNIQELTNLKETIVPLDIATKNKLLPHMVNTHVSDYGSVQKVLYDNIDANLTGTSLQINNLLDDLKVKTNLQTNSVFKYIKQFDMELDTTITSDTTTVETDVAKYPNISTALDSIQYSPNFPSLDSNTVKDLRTQFADSSGQIDKFALKNVNPELVDVLNTLDLFDTTETEVVTTDTTYSVDYPEASKLNWGVTQHDMMPNLTTAINVGDWKNVDAIVDKIQSNANRDSRQFLKVRGIANSDNFEGITNNISNIMDATGGKTPFRDFHELNATTSILEGIVADGDVSQWGTLLSEIPSVYAGDTGISMVFRQLHQHYNSMVGQNFSDKEINDQMTALAMHVGGYVSANATSVGDKKLHPLLSQLETNINQWNAIATGTKFDNPTSNTSIDYSENLLSKEIRLADGYDTLEEDVAGYLSTFMTPYSYNTKGGLAGYKHPSVVEAKGSAEVIIGNYISHAGEGIGAPSNWKEVNSLWSDYNKLKGTNVTAANEKLDKIKALFADDSIADDWGEDISVYGFDIMGGGGSWFGPSGKTQHKDLAQHINKMFDILKLANHADDILAGISGVKLSSSQNVTPGSANTSSGAKP